MSLSIGGKFKGDKGDPGDPGAKFLATLDLDGSVEIELDSHWGIGSDGVPYYDTVAADAVDAAWPSIDTDGTFVLTQFTGGTA